VPQSVDGSEASHWEHGKCGAALEREAPRFLSRHKDPLASVTTVLNRLVDYGEARSLTNERGRRVWEWVSDPGQQPTS